jgi:hypothetical protein
LVAAEVFLDYILEEHGCSVASAELFESSEAVSSDAKAVGSADPDGVGFVATWEGELGEDSVASFFYGDRCHDSEDVAVVIEGCSFTPWVGCYSSPSR